MFRRNFPELPARDHIQKHLVFPNFRELPRRSGPNASETTPFSNSNPRGLDGSLAVFHGANNDTWLHDNSGTGACTLRPVVGDEDFDSDANLKKCQAVT